MKEHPILFSGPMIRAILDGHKTQTRRVVKPQAAILTDELARSLGVQPPAVQNPPVIPCPYGIPGDRLWVRETHCSFLGEPPKGFARADAVSSAMSDGTQATTCYRASGNETPLPHLKWRPSIHMPRWASRILLEVVAVRVERLQEITEVDARAEGYHPRSPDYPVGWFHNLWDDINGAGSWHANPWVWVIEFRRLQP